MTETKFEVEIDETTGLPLVPEGFFWRVGESRWGDYDDDPAVYLMVRKLTDVRKPKKFLGIFDVGEYKYVKEIGDVIESSRSFENSTTGREEVPEGSTNIRSYLLGSSGVTGYTYTEPVNEETIRARAIEIMETRLRAEESQKEWERREAERQAVKDKYYGDYPPKTLVK